MRCVILYGGVSAEHDITLRSCHFILQKIEAKWEPILIGISKTGTWYQQDPQAKQHELNSGNQLTISTQNPTSPEEVFSSPRNQNIVVWPMLHGPYGEDGRIQGLLESYGVAYVGCNVLGSSLAMHKPLSKIIAKASGVSIVGFQHFNKQDWAKNKKSMLDGIKKLKTPLYVKPVAMGSSIGITRIENLDEIDKAVESAFLYDSECIIEEEIIAREVEIAVFGGNDKLTVSEPGEIVTESTFYDFKEKYSKTSNARTDIPANLKSETISNLKNTAVKVFRALHLFGLARMDFFVTKDGLVYFNEANSMPGFTSISLYPRLMEHAGMQASDLINNLLELAVSRHKEQKLHAVQ